MNLMSFPTQQSLSIDIQDVVIVCAAIALIVFIQQMVPRIADRLPGRYRFWILPLSPIFRSIVTVLVLVQLILRRYESGDVWVAMGAIILAIGWAFNDFISSIIAGIVSLYERPFSVGDWVSIDGDYGEVREVGLRAIKIVTPDDTMVTIPHKKLWDHNISNANAGQQEHQCVANFYVAPNHHAEAVRQSLYDVALTSVYTRMESPIAVIVLEKPWGTHYRLKAYPTDGRNEFRFISDLTVRGKATLQALQIEFAHVPLSVAEN